MPSLSGVVRARNGGTTRTYQCTNAPMHARCVGAGLLQMCKQLVLARVQGISLRACGAFACGVVGPSIRAHRDMHVRVCLLVHFNRAYDDATGSVEKAPAKALTREYIYVRLSACIYVCRAGVIPRIHSWFRVSRFALFYFSTSVDQSRFHSHPCCSYSPCTGGFPSPPFYKFFFLSSCFP